MFPHHTSREERGGRHTGRAGGGLTHSHLIIDEHFLDLLFVFCLFFVLVVHNVCCLFVFSCSRRIKHPSPFTSDSPPLKNNKGTSRLSRIEEDFPVPPSALEASAISTIDTQLESSDESKVQGREEIGDGCIRPDSQ